MTKKTIKEMKNEYETALEEFVPLRNEEVDGENGLSAVQVERYMYLLETTLLPLCDLLFKLGEEKYLNENTFSYEM